MDNITELLVKKKKNGPDDLKTIGLVFFAFVLAAAALRFTGNFSVIIIIAIVFVTYKILLKFDLEFEYCLVDKEFRIDKIMSKKKRKEMLVVEDDQIEFIAKLSDVSEHEKNSGKLYFAAETMQDDQNYFMRANKAGNAICVIFKGDEKVLAHLKRVMPSKMRKNG